jgi:putative protease
MSGHESPQKIPELLAPAGSPAAFRAAIAAGADAVYLGGKEFGARRYAQNFSLLEIGEAVRFAHARGVRVYVTVNILVHDRELPDAARYLVDLYAIGADAVLVQDPGLAALAREVVPGLPLHASTQMTVHSADGVRWAAGQGFSRVVLARELGLHDVRVIARITADLGIGLEVFAHGALCYCYSGQCLLSSVIGGRSGNRGMCAQPCRKPYMLVAAQADRYGRPAGLRDLPLEEPYLLSPKDLCTYTRLPELVGSPVAALKIEGRMKSPEYVAVVVSTYRRALDAIAEGTWQPDDSAVRDLLLSFNREFTGGYLFGDRHGTLMGRARPDNRGLCVGPVMRWDRRSRTVTVRATRPVSLRPGDGMLFAHPGYPSSDWGFSLNTEPVRENNTISFATPRTVVPGAHLYITASSELLARARQIASQAPAALRHPVPVDLATKVSGDGTLELYGTIEAPGRNPVIVSQRTDLRLAPARSRPISREELSAQIQKTGGTPFAVHTFTLDYTGDRFAPLGELNRVRRGFFEAAEAALVAAATPLPEDVAAAGSRLAALTARLSRDSWTTGEEAPPSAPIIFLADRIDTVDAALRAGAGIIGVEPSIAPDGPACDMVALGEKIAAGVSSVCARCSVSGARPVWKLPRVTTQPFLDAVLPHLPGLRRDGLDECMVENMGTAQAVLSAEPGMALSGFVGLNIFNHLTVHVLSGLPFRLLTLSPELSGTEIRTLSAAAGDRKGAPPLAVLVQGNVEAMISEDCLLEPLLQCRHPPPGRPPGPNNWYGIRDGTGHVFPVRVDAACRTHIFNARETCLVDAIPRLIRTGISAFVIDGRGRTPAYADEMVRIYRDAVAARDLAPEAAAPILSDAKARAKEIALGGITAGHFLRGLRRS